MKITKFRGFSLKGYWCFGYYFYSELKQKHFIIGESKDYGYQEEEVYSDSVGQYTNLDDKNGKEIYDGDIIEFGWQNKRRSLVTFEKGCFMQKTNILYIGHSECEVIGNIFENPELINGE
jgi:hypothetical protein